MLRYSCIAFLVITKVKSVYYAVRNESLRKTDAFLLRRINRLALELDI